LPRTPGTGRYWWSSERTGENQISLTDPDSRAIAAHTKVGVGYNAQVAVDAKHKMLVEQAVTNQVVDMGDTRMHVIGFALCLKLANSKQPS
jgi:hypothetical protein